MADRHDYAAFKARAAARSRAQSLAGRDIGDIPPVVDHARKLRAARSFQSFAEQYFPAKFYLPWSPDHLRILGIIEQVVTSGGTFALAMPRGNGKTTLCETACLWAMLFGHTAFTVLIGASEDHALRMLSNLKTELSGNDLLLADFPETCYPVRRLENEARRCIGQQHHGSPTHIGWSADEIVLPTIPGSQAAGAVVRVAGITGNIRGAVHTRPDGSSIRPSLVILDDPQTDQSARSPSQCSQRESIVNGAVLGLAGPGRTIAALMPCTVIQQGDLADRYLDRDAHPQWQGQRTKLLYAMPKAAKLWDEYAQVRGDGMREGKGTKPATDFYAKHRAAMDAGAEPAWEHRFNPGELSAIQHAMNLKLDRGEAAFAAEYQNQPLAQDADAADRLTPEIILTRLNSRPRGAVPPDASAVTAFVDVQERCLYYAVVAWRQDATGYVVDYGTWPDQGLLYFSLREVGRTLRRHYPGAGTEGAIRQGLLDLLGRLLGRRWSVPGSPGAALVIERCLVDSGYLPAIVADACRVSGAVALPSKGVGIRAGHRPMHSYARRPGERHGDNWYLPNVARTREVRHVLYDTNHWKTWLHNRLATTPGDPGSMTLWGTKGHQHRMIADHVAASESWTETQGHGRMVHEWSILPTRPDNHWFDCLVGCCVAGSMLGVRLPNSGESENTGRKKYTRDELLQRFGKGR